MCNILTKAKIKNRFVSEFRPGEKHFLPTRPQEMLPFLMRMVQTLFFYSRLRVLSCAAALIIILKKQYTQRSRIRSCLHDPGYSIITK